MHAHVPAGQGETYRDEVLFLFVANGVTTIRGMLGHPDHLQLRKALADNQILGPRLITSGPSFSGRSGSTAQRTERMVREQHAAGYDFLKIHPGVPLAAYDAMVAVADELGMTRHDVYVAKHRVTERLREIAGRIETAYDAED